MLYAMQHNRFIMALNAQDGLNPKQIGLLQREQNLQP